MQAILAISLWRLEPPSACSLASSASAFPSEELDYYCSTGSTRTNPTFPVAFILSFPLSSLSHPLSLYMNIFQYIVDFIVLVYGVFIVEHTPT